jgi:hypothetical protein
MYVHLLELPLIRPHCLLYELYEVGFSDPPEWRQTLYDPLAL